MEEYDDGSYFQSVAVTSLPKIVSRKKQNQQLDKKVDGNGNGNENGNGNGNGNGNDVSASNTTTTVSTSTSITANIASGVASVGNGKDKDKDYSLDAEATAALLLKSNSGSISSVTSTVDGVNSGSVVSVDLSAADENDIVVKENNQKNNTGSSTVSNIGDAGAGAGLQLDVVREHFIWTPLSDNSSTEFDTFLEKRIKASFKNDSKPREHQWKTIQSVVKDLAYPKFQSSFQNGKRYNYLIQHAAGSGKSLTIALLVYTLYKLEINNRLKFDTIVIMNDRSQLDAQLGDVIVKFLESNGVKNYCRPKTSKQLQYEISHGKNRIVITTMQKFSQLLPSAGKSHVNENGQYSDFAFKTNSVAIISDEAHRSHGKSTTERLHEFLVGNVKQTSQITYFSFTCTPTPQCLEMFGVSSSGSDKRPFYTYSMEEALKDRLILDVLENFKSWNIKDATTSLPVVHYGSNEQMHYYDDPYAHAPEQLPYNWEGDDDDFYYYEDNENVAEEEPTQDKTAIQEKSIFILNHFISMKKKFDTKQFKSRGMIVCSGRKNLLVYKKTIDSIMEKLPASEQFDTIAAFSPFSIDGKMILESDVAVNGKYAHFGTDKNRGIVKALQEDKQTKIRLLIVADKLQTGFDEPSLSMMYVDKKIKGANIVQTLSRLSRISDEKSKTSIIDFVNREHEIKQVFDIYSKSTTLNDLQGEAFLLSKLRVAADNIKEIYSHERNTKSFAKSIQFHQAKGNKKYTEVERDIEDFINIYTKLERSEIVDILTPISYTTVLSVKEALDKLKEEQLNSIKESTSHYTIRVRIDNLTDLELKNTLELSNQNVDYDADFAASLWADKKEPSPEKKRESTIQRLKETSKQLLGQQNQQQQQQPPKLAATSKSISPLLASSSFSYNAFGSSISSTEVKKLPPINRSVSVWSMASQSNLGKRSFQPQFQPTVKKQKEET